MDDFDAGAMAEKIREAIVGWGESLFVFVWV